MIKLNLKNAVTNGAISKYAQIVKKAAQAMECLDAEGSEFLGWKDLPLQYDQVEFKAMLRKAKMLASEHTEVLVVLGIGGSSAGAQAGLGMLRGRYHLNKEMEIIFAGDSLSATDLAQKLAYVANKNFAINVISKSGATLEPALAFRLFRKLLEAKVGPNNAAKFIIVTTDANKGALIKIAQNNDYTIFYIPDNIGGRFSVLTPVGLFPLACAGIDIKGVMEGAGEATRQFGKEDLATNDAYRYAVARFILMKKYPVELMVQYEPQMAGFSEWWKQLAAESEGKNRKGLFPASAIFSTDLHSLGQFIQDGSKVLFETVMTVAAPHVDVNLFEDAKNLDNLNYLVPRSIADINRVAFKATTEAHVKVGKVPNLHIELAKLDAAAFGQLVIFFERAVAMTAYLMNVNPFNQPGVEVYKQNMFKQLGKPE